MTPIELLGVVRRRSYRFYAKKWPFPVLPQHECLSSDDWTMNIDIDVTEICPKSVYVPSQNAFGDFERKMYHGIEDGWRADTQLRC